MWNVADPDLISTQLERDLGAGQGAHDVEREARGEHRGPGTGDLGGERHAECHLHVGGPQLDPVLPRGELDAGERLHGTAGRRHALDRLELREELGARAGDLHDGCLSVSWKS